MSKDKQPKENPMKRLTDEELKKAYLGALSEDDCDVDFLVELSNELKARGLDPLK